MENEFVVDGHKVTHTVQLGDKEIFVAIQENVPLPFYVGYMEVVGELGLVRYSEVSGTDDYTEAWEIANNLVKKQIEQVRVERTARNLPHQILTEVDCIARSQYSEYNGKVLVLRTETLRPEYWSADHQLVFATGGFGASTEGRGRKVYCTSVYSGNHFYIARTDVLGIIKPENLPDWAKEKVAVLEEKYHQQQEKQEQDIEAARRQKAARTSGKEKGDAR